jgi:4-alpha-glucanotransferase
MPRQAGVVLPLFSIRTRRDWGVGEIASLPACAAWVRGAGHKLLQVLPPHELSSGETSPYGALTAFALDPIYLNVEAIAEVDQALIDTALGEEGKKELDRVRATPRVDYGAVRALKAQVVRAAFRRFVEAHWSRDTPRARKLTEFMRTEASWLDDFALYCAIRESRSGWGWRTWSEDLRDRAVSAVHRARADNATRVLEVAYVQWQLFDQWAHALEQMRSVGVELMGDLPFIVGAESADVWSHTAQFELQVSLGAPPDDYSEEGQDWGLPAYDWLAMEGDGLGWIRARARHAARLYDRFRLDHVVGFFRQWVRFKHATSRGRFEPEGLAAQRARGTRVLGAMRAEVAQNTTVPGARLIAEDLGVIPQFVRETLVELSMPGYRVLPWERDGERYHDPREFPRLSVACWSTHDTPPIDAWWNEFSETERRSIGSRAGITPSMDSDARSLALLGDLYRSRSSLALVLVQELLGLQDRINKPATVGEQNWTWRFPAPLEDLQADTHTRARFDSIRALVEASDR